MKGIIFWACSNCRSTIGFYREFARQLNVPMVVAIWFTQKGGTCAVRSELGFRADEFKDIEMVVVGEDYKKGIELIDSHSGWHNLFGVYHGAPNYQRLLQECKRRGLKAGVICEAPCNMSTGFRRHLKEVYLKWILPLTVKRVVRAADFFVSLSGDSSGWVRNNGWSDDKIIPFGYYPPAIEGTVPVLRTSNKPFHILATGKMTPYRGADVLMKALILLKRWGVTFKATITQEGELLPLLEHYMSKYDLPVELAGFVEIGRLKELYATASVFVGAGRDEPWGMRLNDVLQCGMPLVVSRGMGGVQLVDRYHCGASFEREDYVDLANKLRMMALDAEYYRLCAANAYSVAKQISPEIMAGKLISEIRSRFNGWFA